MQALYFAYGSNLCSARLRQRVASARAEGHAWLPGHRLTTDKRGRDGSAKANLRRDASSGVWGVVYRIGTLHWPDLDACEGGYQRLEVELLTPERELLVAETYLSTLFTDDPVLSRPYKEFLVRGAREHGLPEVWVAHLEALPERA